jgi:hypothetical protein
LATDPLTLLRARDKAATDWRDGWGLRALPGGKGSLVYQHRSALVDAAAIDRGRMAVPCTITDEEPDRYKDVVVTRGLSLDNHRANPTVMYDHGLFDAMRLQIAKAEDPEGNYTVVAEEKRVRAVSWFSQSLLEAEQYFQLIEEGMLRGVSIQFTPLKAAPRQDGIPDGSWPGLLVSESELIEYSHTPMPVNPRALADRIGKGILAGKPIAPAVMKSLAPHLPPPAPKPVPVRLPPEKKSMPTTTKTAPAPVKKAGMTETGEYVPLEEDSSTTTTAENPKTDFAEEESPSADRPPGSIFLEGLHDRFMELADFIEKESVKQENPAVTDIAAEHSADITSKMEGLAEAYSKQYPDLDELVGKAVDVSGDDEDETVRKGEADDEIEDEEGTGEEDDVDGTGGGKKRKSRSPEAVRRLIARVKRIRADRAERAARNPALKRLSKMAKSVCMKAAGYCDEIAGHEGELRETHKSAASYHSSALKALATSGGPEDDVDNEEMKALRKQNVALKAALAESRKLTERIRTEFRRRLRGQ